MQLTGGKKERLTLMLAPEIIEQVRENAKKYGLSNSAYAGFVIADYFAQIERLKGAVVTATQRAETEAKAMEMMTAMMADMRKITEEIKAEVPE